MSNIYLDTAICNGPLTPSLYHNLTLPRNLCVWFGTTVCLHCPHADYVASICSHGGPPDYCGACRLPCPCRNVTVETKRAKL